MAFLKCEDYGWYSFITDSCLAIRLEWPINYPPVYLSVIVLYIFKDYLCPTCCSLGKAVMMMDQ
jgi:hypothetical protein